MENNRIVIYFPGTFRKNFSNFFDLLEASHYASTQEAKNSLKSLMAPMTDRVHRLIVGEKASDQYRANQDYNAEVRGEIKNIRQIMRDNLEAAEDLRAREHLSGGEINSLGGLDNAISIAKKDGLASLQKELEDLRDSYKIQQDNLEQIEALKQDHEKSERVARNRTSWFQNMRNSVGDRFLNTLGMGKNWDPSWANSWEQNFVDYLANKNMPESLRNLYNMGDQAAATAYRFSPDLGNNLSKLMDKARDPIRNKVKDKIYSSIGGIFPAFLSAASVRHPAPRYMNQRDYYVDPNETLSAQIQRLQQQQEASLKSLRGGHTTS